MNQPFSQPLKTRLLLGPQRPVTNLGDAVKAAGIPEGPVAVISAGWQEAEGDIDDVQQLIPRPLVDLRLYHRAEEIFATQRQLHELYRSRQDQLKELQRLYRLRLRQLMIAARHTLKADARSEWFWHRIAWAEFLTLLCWSVAGLQIGVLIPAQHRTGAKTGILPILSFFVAATATIASLAGTRVT